MKKKYFIYILHKLLSEFLFEGVFLWQQKELINPLRLRELTHVDSVPVRQPSAEERSSHADVQRAARDLSRPKGLKASLDLI